MKTTVKQLYNKKVSELTVEELVNTIQSAIEKAVMPKRKDIPVEIACLDENLFRMVQEHPENYVIGMKALSQLIGCSIRKTFDLRKTGIFDEATFECGQKLIFNKAMVIEAYSQQGMFLKGRKLRNRILEYKATAL